MREEKQFYQFTDFYDIEDSVLRNIMVNVYEERFHGLTVNVVLRILKEYNIANSVLCDFVENYETREMDCVANIYTKNLIFTFKNDLLITIETREDIREEMLEKYDIIVELDADDPSSIAYFDDKEYTEKIDFYNDIEEEMFEDEFDEDYELFIDEDFDDYD